MRVDLTAMKNLPSKRASRLRRARSRTSRVRPETASTNLTLVSGARSYWPYSAVVRHLGAKPLPQAFMQASGHRSIHDLFPCVGQAEAPQVSVCWSPSRGSQL